MGRANRELAELNQKGAPATLSMWLSNKTADKMRQWIAAHTVLVAVEGERITGVAAVRADRLAATRCRRAGQLQPISPPADPLKDLGEGRLAAVIESAGFRVCLSVCLSRFAIA